VQEEVQEWGKAMEREQGAHEVERRCEVMVGDVKILEYYWILSLHVCRRLMIALGWKYDDHS